MTVKDMLGRSGVISKEEALRILTEEVPGALPEAETIELGLVLDRITARDQVSPSDLPEFNRSTMDGFAVRSADTFGASEASAAVFTVIGDIPMGTMPQQALGKGQSMKIATGGALPAGADAVVMFEHIQAIDERTIEAVKPAAPLENVIQAGDDMKKGEVILRRGHKLRPQDLAALAAAGITCVPVFRKPRVAIISTGNELVSADTLPGPGRIRDTNSYNLEGLVLQNGGAPLKKGIVRDVYERLHEALEAAVSDCDLVLLTGGSSVGVADLTAKVINAFGPPGVLVHGVSIKPGKPLIIGLAGKKHSATLVPVFGLPGHPAAVNICFELFVKPVLARLTGEVRPAALEGIALNRQVKARLARGIASSPGREDHVRVLLERREDGLWARPIFGASGLISTLVKAVGTVVVPVNKIGIEAGEEVDVRLF